ncbi:USH1 protein network component harmonin binding protein 1, transcript variant X1 [Ictidomys tridecemlineatus]|uniref:USH1 protein network component harmonin binding protein 1 n=1 Tax=Ictidomys tridecemlineatus TaxID=43179 RepID=I3MKM6_ICTTR|nr:Usher syndrome type-1C protein-binding protein 1 isoform X1 [Ictidomys tridecemlineatus]KAG3279974.1 USH1 protein network component harmonin binding protein 1, transcript variant X1 [Ictidomys tridecemlineatus]
MSARATRPRSRRGRHLPPGELDPVAESSEEAEAGSVNSKPNPEPPQESFRPEPPRPMVEVSGQGPGSRTSKDAEDSGGGLASAPEGPQEPAVESHQAPETTLLDRKTVPTGTAAPDVFQTLQHVLSSLEAAAAAWRHRPPSCPGPVEAEGETEGARGPCAQQEGAGGCCQKEAARLAEKNAWLRLALGSREDELVRTQASLQAIRAEKEALQREVQELQDSIMRLESSPPPSRHQAGGPGSDSSSSGADGELWGTQDSSLVHPLLRRLRSDSSTHILGSLSTQQPLSPETHIMESRLEQLQGSIEKLKCFNRLLLAVLQGHKGRCESLSMQLGQREAEATALRLALQYSEDCEEAYGALLALREADSGTGDEVAQGDLQVAEKEAWRLLAQKEAAMDGGTPQPSPEGSSVDKPTPQEVASRLQRYVQRLQERRALVKIPPGPGPTSAPLPTVPHAEAMVQAILETQPGPALPRLEKMQIQQDLLATRETLAELMLQLQLVRREKRGLELRDAALRAQGPAHVLLLEQLQWEQAQLGAGGVDSSGGGSSAGGSSGDEEEWAQGPPAVPGGSSGLDGGQLGRMWDPEKLAKEIEASVTRTLDLREQMQSLREQLEQVAQKGRARRTHSAELNSDLCKAHSALVLAFRGAHRKQEEQCRKLEQQMERMEARQAEELAVLEATARALGGRRPPCPPPQLGETLL